MTGIWRQEDEANSIAQRDFGDVSIVMYSKVISKKRNIDVAVKALLDCNEVLDNSDPSRSRRVAGLAEVVLDLGAQPLRSLSKTSKYAPIR